MNDSVKRLAFMRIVCWIGMVVDALWAVALLLPALYGILTGQPAFDPDLQFRLAMGIGGSLMAGWTVLLFWVSIRPVERRAVLLMTAFPVVFGLFVIALIRVLGGHMFGIWILAKCLILFVIMVIGYALAADMDKQARRAG